MAFVRSRQGVETRGDAGQERACTRSTPTSRTGSRPTAAATCPRTGASSSSSCSPGELLGVAATNALELGIDIAGLDAVVMAGFPGTRASMWQQIGRSGRESQGGLGVLVARDDPLDTYLVTHPESLLGAPVEATVFDAGNPYVVAPHLCAAAQEIPLTEDDFGLFDGDVAAVVASLESAGYLRRRARGWFWTRRDRAADLADIRSSGGSPVRVVEGATGRLVGTVDAASADSHGPPRCRLRAPGRDLSRGRTTTPTESVAVVELARPEYSTFARSVTDIRIVEADVTAAWGDAELSLRHGRGVDPGGRLPQATQSPPARCSARSRWTCRPTT